MLKASDCLKKYGVPENEENMVLWDVPANLEIGAIPKRLYCNKDIIPHLSQAFQNAISRGVVNQIKTFDGCFNIRVQRGSSVSRSLHSWGVAVDINASWNRLGDRPTMTPALVRCFTDAGFDWGGAWARPDGMHFQLAKI